MDGFIFWGVFLTISSKWLTYSPFRALNSVHYLDSNSHEPPLYHRNLCNAAGYRFQSNTPLNFRTKWMIIRVFFYLAKLKAKFMQTAKMILPDDSTVLPHHHCFLVQRFHPLPASFHQFECLSCLSMVHVHSPNSFYNHQCPCKMNACNSLRSRMHMKNWMFGSKYCYRRQTVWETIAHVNLQKWKAIKLNESDFTRNGQKNMIKARKKMQKLV